MSLYGALFSGVSGLQAQSSAMSAIADNVTNVNTVGYKNTTVNFQTLVTQQASSTQYSAGGVQSRPRQNIDAQGLLQGTTRALDMAISGNGFFIVNEAGAPGSGDIYAYSRAGSFDVDRNGYLVNTGGYYLQGWPLQNFDGATQAVTKTINDDVYMKAYQNTQGETVYINDNIVDNNNLRPLNLREIGGTAIATSSISISGNLPKDAAIGNINKTDVLIYDSLGSPHNINHSWIKRDTNAWDLSVIPPRGSESIVIEDQTTSRNNYQSVGRLDLDRIPDVGSRMTMEIGGNTYNIDFTTSSETSALPTDSLDITQAAIDGDEIEITIGGVTRIFEFDSDSPPSVNGTNVAVPITVGASATETAAALAAAVETEFDSSLGEGTWASVNATTITLNNTSAGGAGNDSYRFASDPTGMQLSVNGGANAVGTAQDISVGANIVTPADPSAANEDGIGTGIIEVPTSGRSLSQIMDSLADKVQSILQYEFGGVTASPPNRWAERIAGETGLFFHNVDTSDAITVNASGLQTAGVNSVLQDSLFSVEALGATSNWVSGAQAIEFNGDGTPDKFMGIDEAQASSPRLQYKINWANGAENMDGTEGSAITVDWGDYNVSNGMTQFGGPYQTGAISQNGAAFGNFAGLSVGQDGVVTALFDNGVTRPIFMIPIATLGNPNGMSSLTGNVFIETDGSGQPIIREAGSAGAGTVNQSAVEASTVDLGSEFTSMITTQRAYSAASKIISTSDEMLEELLRVIR